VEPEAQFKIDELAEATDLSRRTIHHYIAEGLIPRARGGAGPAAYYDEEHYLRLRLLTRLKAMGLSMGTIRDSLNDLSLEEMREILEMPEELDYRAIWTHIAMKRSGTPESFLVEEAELADSHEEMEWDSPPEMSPGRSWRPRWTRRAKPGRTSTPLDNANLRREVADESSPPGAIRRDPDFVHRLADEHPRAPVESSRGRVAHTQDILGGDLVDDSLEALEAKHPVPDMMAAASNSEATTSYREAAATDPGDEFLHPELQSQPWRRVRVSNDLEISYRPSSDPLTRKKLHHLFDFVHRLFRLERSSEGRSSGATMPDGLTPDGLTPETFIADGGPAAGRSPQHDSDSMGGARAHGEHPQEEEP
jgi:DNA-binding transcriptional MerR regulator